MSNYEPTLENEKTPLPDATAAGFSEGERRMLDAEEITPFEGSRKVRSSSSQPWRRRISKASNWDEARYLAITRGGEPEDYLQSWRGPFCDGYQARSLPVNAPGEEWELEDQFFYRARDRELYARVDKFRSAKTGEKAFRQFHWERGWPDGRWAPGKPPGGRIPYNLQYWNEYLVGEEIFFAEGEKDAESLVDLGLHCSAVSNGAKAPFTPELASYFGGFKRVFVLADNDAPGREFAEKVANRLAEVVREIRIVHFPDVKEGGDISDWIADCKAEGLANEQIKERLLERVANAQPYRKPARRPYTPARKLSPRAAQGLYVDALLGIRRAKAGDWYETVRYWSLRLSGPILDGTLDCDLARADVVEAASAVTSDLSMVGSLFDDCLSYAAKARVNKGGVL